MSLYDLIKDAVSNKYHEQGEPSDPLYRKSNPYNSTPAYDWPTPNAQGNYTIDDAVNRVLMNKAVDRHNHAAGAHEAVRMYPEPGALTDRPQQRFYGEAEHAQPIPHSAAQSPYSAQSPSLQGLLKAVAAEEHERRFMDTRSTLYPGGLSDRERAQLPNDELTREDRARLGR